MTHKKLLKNIYYAAKHHQELNDGLRNDLLRSEILRAKNEGLHDAYAHIVQMVIYSDRIGIADYKKVFKMEETFPKKLY